MKAEGSRLARRSVLRQWAVLLGLSLVLVLVALWIRLPAALMIGPMVAAVFVAASEGTIRIPPRSMIPVQGIIGFLMGRAIPLTILDDLARDWPLVLLGLVGVVAAASAIGLLLTRSGALPGTTGIWGSSPGASTPMILMSEEYGGDPRLVAVMQQLRILMVIAIAAVVARIWTPDEPSGSAAAAWLAPVAWPAFAVTVSLAVGTAYLAMWLRIPAGPMLVPLATAVLLQETGLLHIELPPWLLAGCYALVGWNIGLRFTRPVLWYAFRALPVMLASTLALIVLCGLLAGAMVLVGGIDPLTAYLATSPGGADSIAIIAASSNVDMRFVMAMQTSRLVIALLLAPGLSRWMARKAGGGGPG
ncbi:MAG: AbrB family transcriptional regulator [Hyphomicrobiaceae bacterium]